MKIFVAKKNHKKKFTFWIDLIIQICFNFIVLFQLWINLVSLKMLFLRKVGLIPETVFRDFLISLIEQLDLFVHLFTAKVFNLEDHFNFYQEMFRRRVIILVWICE